MISPRRDVQRVQDAIDVQMRIAAVSGAQRRMRTPARIGAAAPPALFLVKSGATFPGQVPVSGHASKKEEKQKESERAAGRVIPFKMPSSQKEHEQLLGLMAALGPVLWFVHELFVWLKVF